ncbi:MAG: cadherin-like beta sandwich domain-containing protein, partial [Cyclobacteriaceae bacterium]
IGEYVITAVATDANGSKNYAIRNIIRTSSDVAKDLELVGVFALRWSTEPSVNSGKGIHLKALADIPDLSVYSIGVANNGDGTDGIEYTFPVMSVAAGDDILLAREDDALTAYFGDCADEIEHVIQADVMNQNGDDAIELYSGFTVIETYGDANVDGTGQEWEYTGSWAYKDNGAWIYGGLDCAANSTSMQDAECTYPLCIPPVITNDATLSQLLVDGEAIEGFVSGLLNYAIELPFDRTIVPEVSATTTDAGASLSINDAESLPGITSVVVTAVDGTTQRTYTIAFTLAEGGGTTLGMEEFEDIQIIMNNGRLYVKGESLRGIHSVEVYSLSGRKLNTHQTNNEVIAELHVPRGAVAIVRLMDEVGNMVYSKKIFIERQ